MKKQPRIVLVLIALMHVRRAFGQEFCPETDVVDDFSPDKIAGTWYAFAKFPNEFDVGMKCTSAETVPYGGDKYYYDINGIGKYYGDRIEYQVFFDYVDQPNVGRLRTTVNRGGGNRTFPLDIIASDYESYIVYYHCEIASDEVVQRGWIMAKERFPGASFQDEMNDLLMDNGIDWTVEEPVDQTDCD